MHCLYVTQASFDIQNSFLYFTSNIKAKLILSWCLSNSDLEFFSGGINAFRLNLFAYIFPEKFKKSVHFPRFSFLVH